MTTALDYAQQYHACGFAPIPIPAGSKNPNRQGWQRERYSFEDLPVRFSNGANIGLLLGEPSHGLVDVDLDCPKARIIAEHVLPETEMVSGRDSAPRSHFWYLCDPLVKTTKFVDPTLSEKDDRAMIVELRSTGGQTVVAPSIHPCGESYQWYGPLNPTRVDGDKLLEKVSALAACTLVARHCERGRRHDIALALAGALLRAGWGQQRVEGFIRLVATAAGDDELDDRLKAVSTTQEAIKAGGLATGLPTLSELLGENVVNRFCKWLRLPAGTFGIFGTAEGGVSQKKEEWPDPDPLPCGLLPVPKMAQELLPEPFRPWLSDVVERMQCPLEYPTVAAFVGLSSLIGDRLAMRPKKRDDWRVIPNLWGAIIGPPGLLKTPALDEGLRPLRRLEAEARTEYEEAIKNREFDKLRREAEKKDLKDSLLKAVRAKDEAEIESLRARIATLEDTAEPTERRFIINDSTVEKLGELLNQNPHGFLMFRDELSGFLRNLDREGREGDRAFYLEAWTGHTRFSYDRIGRGTLQIESVTLSILGGIQPGPLSQYLHGAIAGGMGDDGLLQRFQLLVYPDPPRTWRNVDRYPDTDAKNRAYEVFKKLRAPDAATLGAVTDDSSDVPFLRFDDEAQVFFDSWREDLENELRSGMLGHAALEAHLAKYRSLMPSMALLFHLIDRSAGLTDQPPVSLDAAERAAAWCSFLFKHAERIYGLAVDASAQLAKTLISHIQQNELPDPFTARDVYRKHWTGLTTPKVIAEPLDLLCDLNWLRLVEVQRGGRPTQHYFMNPKIKGGQK